MSPRTVLCFGLILIGVPLALVLFYKIGDRYYWLYSVIVLLLAMLPFFFRFERRKPAAGELVMLAVMCALAVASRAAFVMLPNFKPIVGIIMIAGIGLGAEAGFLTGAIGAFASNMMFGMGVWTPWQMFAYGIAGFIAGVLAKPGIMNPQRRVVTALIGGLIVLCIVGPILDTSSVLMFSSAYGADQSILSIYLAGAPFNAIHAACVALVLLLLCKPICGKLERVKTKYGITEKK